LKKLITERIKVKGEITFAEFMHMALYHQKYGYYNQDTEHTGKSGDFYTSPTVHQIFGELIAKQIYEMWEIMGFGEFTIAEAGAGSGWLCHDIMQCLKNEHPGCYNNVNYIIIESNPHARKKQCALLDNAGLDEENFSWHEYTDKGFSFNSIHGIFLLNEFIDALPVHRVIMKNGRIREIYVGYDGENLCETDGELSTQTINDYIERNKISLEENQTREIRLAAIDVLKHISEKLIKGFVITIDYGDKTQKLYQNNTEGTLRCYYKHTVNNDFFERIGQQDITAHVDFTHLMNEGKLAGLQVTGFTRQSHYLIALGIIERLNDIKDNYNAILKAKNLFLPEGMGEIFKVLIQHKNIENPCLKSLKPLHLLELDM